MLLLSLDDLFELAAPPNHEVEKEARATFGEAALSLEALLDLGYGTFESDELPDWCALARSRGLARICAADPSGALAWCIAAAHNAWAQWKPVLQAAPNHAFARVEAQVAVALDAASSIDALRAARVDTSALPVRGPPPPYAGHFYGALQALLEARLTSNPSDLAEALSFFCVAPSGDRLTAEIAALAS